MASAAGVVHNHPRCSPNRWYRLPHHRYRLQMDCHWPLPTRYLSDVSIWSRPNGLFLLTVFTTGGRYIIFAGGSLTKVSGIYYAVCITVDSRTNFEIHINQDIWARDLLPTPFVDGPLLSPPGNQDWKGCIHRRPDKTLRM